MQQQKQSRFFTPFTLLSSDGRCSKTEARVSFKYLLEAFGIGRFFNGRLLGYKTKETRGRATADRGPGWRSNFEAAAAGAAAAAAACSWPSPSKPSRMRKEFPFLAWVPPDKIYDEPLLDHCTAPRQPLTSRSFSSSRPSWRSISGAPRPHTRLRVRRGGATILPLTCGHCPTFEPC